MNSARDTECWARSVIRKQRMKSWAVSCLFGVGLLAQGLDAMAALLSFNSGALNSAIPDNDPNGIISTITVSGQTELITDLSVTLNLSGTSGFNGDFYAYLTHDTLSGFAVLLNRPGKTSSNVLGTDGSGFTNVSFSDDAANGDVHVYETTLGGTFSVGDALTGSWAPDGRNVDPENVLDTDSRSALLGSFDGHIPNGDWRLFIADVASGGTLTLDDWSLDVTVSPVPEPHYALVTAVVLGGFAFRRFRTVLKQDVNEL